MAIVIYGNPQYYSKYGFVPASKIEICTKDGDIIDELMATGLFSGAFKGMRTL